MLDSITVIEAPHAEEACPLTARRRKALERIFGSRFLNTFASPYRVIEDHVIECPVAVRFFKKDFNYLSKQLYLEYQYRSWRDFDAALLDRYAGIITNKLAALDTTLQQTINRLQKLLDQAGQQADLTLWPTKFLADVPIIASQARAYLEVLQKLDRVYTLTGTANLLGVIDSTQRAQAELQAKRAVRTFRSVLQTEVTRLYREAERIADEQRQAGKADPAVATAVQQQRQQVAELETTTQRDAAEEATGDESVRIMDAHAGAAAVTA
jgi:hypothetical protein